MTNWMVKDCHVCQKIEKSIIRPKGMLNNKMNAENIIEAMNNAYIYNAGIPFIMLWAENGGVFSYLMMDELAGKHKSSLKLGWAHSMVK